ncbi:MAG: NAD(P)H-dependent oxidoreductase subunit E, partial [Chloroflexota bacterium]
MPALHYAQDIHGWLSEETQREISNALRVPLADVHGVIEFYTMFYNKPTAKKVIRVCDGPACKMNNADGVMASVENNLGLKNGETSKDHSVSYEHVPCLGMCEFAPAGFNNHKPAGELTTAETQAFLDGVHPEPTAKVYGTQLATLHRVGKISPTSLEEYEKKQGYSGLRKALKLEPDKVIELVEESKIFGRGGAQFPTGSKWRYTRAVNKLANQKHIVVNADESEPGTFKDRVLMEEDPFAIIEAAT